MKGPVISMPTNPRASLNVILNRLLSRIADLILLNMMWFLCSIPVLTAGAAYVAMDVVLMRMLEKQDVNVARDFLHAFKMQLKRATWIWLVFLSLVAVLCLNLLICKQAQWNGGYFWIAGASTALLGILISVVFYTNAVLVRLSGKLTTIVKQSAMIAILALPSTIVILILHIFPVVLAWLNLEFFLRSIFIWLIGGTSLIQLISMYLFLKTLQRINNNPAAPRKQGE